MKKLILLLFSVLSFVLCSCEKDNNPIGGEDGLDERLENTKWVSTYVGSGYGFISHTTTKAYVEFSKGYAYVTITGRKTGSGITTTEQVAKGEYSVKGDYVTIEGVSKFKFEGLSALVRTDGEFFLKHLTKQ